MQGSQILGASSDLVLGEGEYSWESEWIADSLDLPPHPSSWSLPYEDAGLMCSGPGISLEEGKGWSPWAYLCLRQSSA